MADRVAGFRCGEAFLEFLSLQPNIASLVGSSARLGSTHVLGRRSCVEFLAHLDDHLRRRGVLTGGIERPITALLALRRRFDCAAQPSQMTMPVMSLSTLATPARMAALTTRV
jgi:hypothetical protein